VLDYSGPFPQAVKLIPWSFCSGLLT